MFYVSTTEKDDSSGNIQIGGDVNIA